MKDRTGMEFNELVAIQREHLQSWYPKLKTDVFNDVTTFCAATRREARTPDDKHTVYRGQDIVQLIMEWPTFNSITFPAPISELAEAVMDCV